MPDRARRSRTHAGGWIAAGLAVQAVSFVLSGPPAFLIFALVGLPLVAVGVVRYLFSLLAGPPGAG